MFSNNEVDRRFESFSPEPSEEEQSLVTHQRRARFPPSEPSGDPDAHLLFTPALGLRLPAAATSDDPLRPVLSGGLLGRAAPRGWGCRAPTRDTPLRQLGRDGGHPHPARGPFAPGGRRRPGRTAERAGGGLLQSGCPLVLHPNDAELLAASGRRLHRL